MIKMVTTDLDDTLLRSDKTISSYTYQVLEKVRDQGIKLIFATGRGHSTDGLLPPGLFDGHVHMNGAKAYVGEELVYDRTIPAHVFAPLLGALSDHGLKVAAEIDGIHFSNFAVNQHWAGFERFVISHFDDSLGQAGKLYALLDHPWQAEVIETLMPDDLYLQISRDQMAMIMHKEAKKSHGVLEIARIFGIGQEQILAFGDDHNDVDMLLYSGRGVAMANAVDAVIEVADELCDISDRDGVAKWLDHHLLNGQGGLS
ncbi:MAG: HAD-IIB family hydrolase [Clostridiaceae bacterium]|jgi:Cof subfamily protein (haloacid dehalogenase superfamily)|nr:HAD-IIB family hydrolase [Clostridiaceae bacterium]